MKYTTTQLAALSRLFSIAVFKEMAKKGQSALFQRLLTEAKLIKEVSPKLTVGEVFNHAFNVLKAEGRRSEYIYKAAICHKLLMGVHSLNTASMLHEFRVASSKADLVILNGTASVYEIKSERDSLVRLTNQIHDYQKVFAKVNVITSKSQVNEVLDTVSNDVGVLCLNRRYQISTIREAVNRVEKTCPITIFESLRINEAIEILNHMSIKVPIVSNTQRYQAMRNLFSELDPTIVHTKMVNILKMTRSQSLLNDYINNLPLSLHAVALSTPLKLDDQARIIQAIKTPLHLALVWS